MTVGTKEPEKLTILILQIPPEQMTEGMCTEGYSQQQNGNNLNVQ